MTTNTLSDNTNPSCVIYQDVYGWWCGLCDREGDVHLDFRDERRVSVGQTHTGPAGLDGGRFHGCYDNKDMIAHGPGFHAEESPFEAVRWHQYGICDLRKPARLFYVKLGGPVFAKRYNVWPSWNRDPNGTAITVPSMLLCSHTSREYLLSINIDVEYLDVLDRECEDRVIELEEKLGKQLRNYRPLIDYLNE